MTRDRQWLRQFLNLGARRHRDDVTEEDVERQEDTVVRALEVLDERPGVVLADEVGMGKTYEALGVVAATRYETPGARTLILTPGRELNTKWVEELHRFGEGEPPVHHGFAHRFRSVGHISEYLAAANEAEIVVAPITIFNSVRGAGMQTYLLSLFFHYKRRSDTLHGNTINAIMRRFRDGSRDVVDVSEDRFLDFASLDDVEPHLEAAFGIDDASSITLDRIFEERGLEGFENVRLVREPGKLWIGFESSPVIPDRSRIKTVQLARNLVVAMNVGVDKHLDGPVSIETAHRLQISRAALGGEQNERNSRTPKRSASHEPHGSNHHHTLLTVSNREVLPRSPRLRLLAFGAWVTGLVAALTTPAVAAGSQGWHGFKCSSCTNGDKCRRDPERREHVGNFSRVAAPSDRRFDSLCETLGLGCSKVVNWEGRKKSCNRGNGNGPRDGSRVAYCTAAGKGRNFRLHES